MKSFDPTPALFVRKHGEIRLRGPDLIEIIGAVLGRGAAFRFRVKGFSMWPVIKDADIVTIAAMPAGRPRLGEVAAFVHPESKALVIHRIIGKRGDDYLVQGDNALKQDGSVSKARILGCVKKVERDGKGVALGLGPERILIALLMRGRLLFHMRFRLWTLISPVIGRNRVCGKDTRPKTSESIRFSEDISAGNQSPPERGSAGAAGDE